MVFALLLAWGAFRRSRGLQMGVPLSQSYAHPKPFPESYGDAQPYSDH